MNKSAELALGPNARASDNVVVSGVAVTPDCANRQDNVPDAITPIKEDISVNKSELVDAIADKAELSRTDAGKALDALTSVVSDALKGGDQVALTGFGTFLSRRREAREGRNPKTGETIQIAAANVPAFKAGKALKDAVN